MDALQKKRIEKKAKWMQGHDLDYFFQKHTVARLLASNLFVFPQIEKR